MVTTVVKKEGATQTCSKCGTDLICRLKKYADYEPTLQWQNYDGNAHFKRTDDNTYSCNIPDENEVAQTRIPNTPTPDTPTSPTTNSNLLPLSSILEKLDHIMLKVDSLDEMIQAIFRYTVDRQLEKK